MKTELKDVIHLYLGCQLKHAEREEHITLTGRMVDSLLKAL